MQVLKAVVLICIFALVSANGPDGHVKRNAMMIQDYSMGIPEDRCTTMITGKKAGKYGPMTTHTADCADCDFRMNRMPAMDHAEGARRKLYEYKGNYPATLTNDRGPTWLVSNLEGTPEQLAEWGAESVTMPYTIPEVPHTYAIVEAGYGIMNEHQLAMGESTCAARFYAYPPSGGGKAMIEVREMSKIALERCKTAKCAIKLMGKLAEDFGYYSADWSGKFEHGHNPNAMGEGGEALTVIDTEESWVFHVLSDDTGESAVWAAQRVPDDHIAVVANSFVIRKIDPHSDDFMFSTNMHAVAERNGLWSGQDGLLDFLPTFGPKRAHAIYSTRRVWRIFDLAAPSLKLPAQTDLRADDYPFSVPVDQVLDAEDLMRFNMDHYEGTEFDLTKAPSGGPYGDPARFDVSPTGNMDIAEAMGGSYERAISMFRTSYSFVATARPLKTNLLAFLWFGQYQPSTSSYMPVYVSAEAPVLLQRGSLNKFSDVPFWNFLAANNYMSRFYKFAIGDIVALRTSLHSAAVKAIAEVEVMVNDIADTMAPATRRTSESIKTVIAEDEYAGEDDLDLVDDVIVGDMRDTVIRALTSTTSEQVAKINKGWRDILPFLITKYHDGYVANNRDKKDISMQKIFYPKWWLKLTGYFLEPPAEGDDVIMFEPSPFQSDLDVPDTALNDELVEGTEYHTDHAVHSPFTIFGLIFVFSAASLYAGYYFGRKAGVCNDTQVDFAASMESTDMCHVQATPTSNSASSAVNALRLPGQMLQQMVPMHGKRGYAPISDEA